MIKLGLLLLLCLTLSGCIPPELAKQIPFSIPGVTPPKEAVEEESAEEPLPDEKPAKVKPLKKPVLKPAKTNFTLMDDGLKLATHLFNPDKPLPNKPVLWIIPAIGARYHDWSSFIAIAQSKGYTVLFTDLRGQGQSATFTHGQTASNLLFSPQDWPQLSKDLARALAAWAKKPLINNNQWVILTSGTGCVVTGQLLGLWPKKNASHLVGMVMWDPRQKAKGLDATDGLMSLKAPLLILGNPNDPLTINAWRVIPKLVAGKVKTISTPSLSNPGPNKQNQIEPVLDWITEEQQ